MKRYYSRRPDSGSVLMSVIWMLAILAVFTVAVNRQASQQLILGPWVRDQVKARALASAGIARAMVALQQDKFLTFDALNEDWASDERAFKDVRFGDGSFSVECIDGFEEDPEKNKPRYGVCDEASRINVNYAPEEVLKALVLATVPGMQNERAVGIAQAILDWRDGDDSELQSGAESIYYRSLANPYNARNGLLESVEELNMIKGIDSEVYAKLKPHVTVYGSKTVNFNTASPQVLQALGLSVELAYKIAEFRKGSDGVTGNKDDQTFQYVEGITPALSSSIAFTAEDFASIANPISQQLVSIQSKTFRIRAVGRLEKDGSVYEHWITCVTSRDGAILYWREGEEG